MNPAFSDTKALHAAAGGASSPARSPSGGAPRDAASSDGQGEGRTAAARTPAFGDLVAMGAIEGERGTARRGGDAPDTPVTRLDRGGSPRMPSAPLRAGSKPEAPREGSVLPDAPAPDRPAIARSVPRPSFDGVAEGRAADAPDAAEDDAMPEGVALPTVIAKPDRPVPVAEGTPTPIPGRAGPEQAPVESFVDNPVDPALAEPSARPVADPADPGVGILTEAVERTPPKAPVETRPASARRSDDAAAPRDAPAPRDGTVPEADARAVRVENMEVSANAPLRPAGAQAPSPDGPRPVQANADTRGATVAEPSPHPSVEMPIRPSDTAGDAVPQRRDGPANEDDAAGRTTRAAVETAPLDTGAARQATAPKPETAPVAITAPAPVSPDAVPRAEASRAEERPVRVRDTAPVDTATAPRPSYASPDRYAPRSFAPREEAPAPRVASGEADPYSIAATMNEPVPSAEAAATLAATAATPVAQATTAATAPSTGAMALAAQMAMPVPVEDAPSGAASGDFVEAVGETPLGLASRGAEGGADVRQTAALQRPTTAEGADALQEIVRTAVVTKGPTTIELRLDPSELGKIDIELSFVDDRVSIMVRGERDDALDLMRRSSDELGRMLRQAGLDLDTLGFSRDQAGERGREQAFRTMAVEVPGDGSAEGTGDLQDTAYAASLSGATRDRVDIRI